MLLLLSVAPAAAQQVMYSNLKDLLEERGDTVTTLRVEKRTRNLINLLGGADFRISVDENSGMSRYLKSRCYAVRVDSALYLNCRKMRYKRYRFGSWYAPALWVKGRLFFSAQPLGQLATGTAAPSTVNKLRGQIGDAIQATGLLDARVFYELDLKTGRAEFLSRDLMLQLLADRPDLREAFEKETSESADVIRPYLLRLRE